MMHRASKISQNNFHHNSIYTGYNGDRTFAAAGPRFWNSLPVQLLNPDITYGLFRRQLKGHLSGNNERGDLWLLICSALEKHLLTYLLNLLTMKGIMALTLMDSGGPMSTISYKAASFPRQCSITIRCGKSLSITVLVWTDECTLPLSMNCDQRIINVLWCKIFRFTFLRHGTNGGCRNA